MIAMLVDASDYHFHANDCPMPDPDRDGARVAALASLLLYSGALLDDVNVIMTNDYLMAGGVIGWRRPRGRHSAARNRRFKFNTKDRVILESWR